MLSLRTSALSFTSFLFSPSIASIFILALAASRRLCYCPIEGCTAKPLEKLSNHFSQVHKLNPEERAKYLGQKRRFATTCTPLKEVCRKTQDPVSTETVEIDDAPSGEEVQEASESQQGEPRPSEVQETRYIGCFSLEEKCLKDFANHLKSRIGGKRSSEQAKEITVDVSKFLYFIVNKDCNINNCLSTN